MALEEHLECANLAEIPLKEALGANEGEDWKRAIHKEFQGLIKNHTWDLVDRPENQSVIGSRLVLRNRCNAEGTAERRKARVVAKGYTQRPGVDFKETFAPVICLGSGRLLLALAVENDRIGPQLDVTTAFLNADIEEQIYMEVPELFEEMLPGIILKEELKNEEVDLRRNASEMLKRIEGGNQVCLMKKEMV